MARIWTSTGACAPGAAGGGRCRRQPASSRTASYAAIIRAHRTTPLVAAGSQGAYDGQSMNEEATDRTRRAAAALQGLCALLALLGRLRDGIGRRRGRDRRQYGERLLPARAVRRESALTAAQARLRARQGRAHRGRRRRRIGASAVGRIGLHALRRLPPGDPRSGAIVGPRRRDPLRQRRRQPGRAPPHLDAHPARLRPGEPRATRAKADRLDRQAAAIIHDDIGFRRPLGHGDGRLGEARLAHQRQFRVAREAAAVVPVRLAVGIGVVADDEGILAWPWAAARRRRPSGGRSAACRRAGPTCPCRESWPRPAHKPGRAPCRRRSSGR